MKHLRENPSHESSILTSAKFASAAQMISLASACNKLIYKPDGQYIISPFHGISKHISDPTPVDSGSVTSAQFMRTSSQVNSNLILDSAPLVESGN